jgi:hypothetical protein
VAINHNWTLYCDLNHRNPYIHGINFSLCSHKSDGHDYEYDSVQTSVIFFTCRLIKIPKTKKVCLFNLGISHVEGALGKPVFVLLRFLFCGHSSQNAARECFQRPPSSAIIVVIIGAIIYVSTFVVGGSGAIIDIVGVIVVIGTVVVMSSAAARMSLLLVGTAVTSGKR